MAIALKLVQKVVEENTVQVLKLVNADNNNEVPFDTAIREGITLDEATFTRLQTLVTLGQRYEEISESQKSEFTDF